MVQSVSEVRSRLKAGTYSPCDRKMQRTETLERNLERDRWIREHYNIDMTAKEIGARLGCSKSAIIGRAHRIGIVDRQQNRA